MDAQSAAVGIVVGAVTGVIATVATYTMLKREEDARTAAQETDLKAQLDEARFEGYNAGWNAFGSSETHVRTAYAKMFEEPQEVTPRGTTLRSVSRAK